MRNTDCSNWEKELSERLKILFGKDSFSEEELTKEFYVDLKIKCGDLFKVSDECFDQDLFWSDGLKQWLISNKDN